jgi:hypothetical protein
MLYYKHYVEHKSAKTQLLQIIAFLTKAKFAIFGVFFDENDVKNLSDVFKYLTVN